MNSTLKKVKIGDVKYVIEVSKGTAMHIEAEYQVTIPDVDKFLQYAQKRIKNIVATKYNNFIAVCDYNQKTHYLFIDITLPSPDVTMTWKEKRIWAYAPDSPITELMTIIEAKMDDIIDGYYDYCNKLHCGEYAYRKPIENISNN